MYHFKQLETDGLKDALFRSFPLFLALIHFSMMLDLPVK
jgi:hypothetical protein